MSLLKPTLGEIVDRLTILTLKIEAAANDPNRLATFIEEQVGLRKQVIQLTSNLPVTYEAALGEHTRQLAQVNKRLWDMEDEIRELRGKAKQSIVDLTDMERERVAVLAFSIPDVNDVRANLIRSINQLLGVSTVEKLYKN